MDKFEVYIHIRQLLDQGFTKTAVAKKLGISRPTLYRYLKKSPKEMAEWIDSTKTRKKKLDPYKKLILSWLREHPDMKSSQVEDWLKERFPDLKVSESTVRSYVRNLRREHNIPKESYNKRDYEAIPDPEMGKQVHVFCNRKVQRNAIKNAEVCHPFNSFSTMRGTVYSSRHEKR